MHSNGGRSNAGFLYDIELNNVDNHYRLPRIRHDEEHKRRSLSPDRDVKRRAHSAPRQHSTHQVHVELNAAGETNLDSIDRGAQIQETKMISRKAAVLKKLYLTTFLVLYCIFFTFAMLRPSKLNEESYWCRGDGFLIVITASVALGITYFQILKPLFLKSFYQNITENSTGKKFISCYENVMSIWWVKLALYILVVAAVVIYLVIETIDELERLTPLLGIAVFLIFGLGASAAPKKVIWRHVIWGMGIQFCLGIIILRWPVGKAIFDCFGEKVHTFLSFTEVGSSFIFERLVSEYEIFAFKVLSVILFFSLFIQILYFYGVMQWIVMKLGWLLQITIGTTACESVNASANIFLGQSEAPLLIKPFLPLMTKSELHAVMTGGFATIAGSVLAAYISFGVDPAHLLSASVMSAPAALAFSKLFYPETEVSKTGAGSIRIEKRTESNALHAAIEGVTTSIPLVANVAANLLAFIAFMAFIDAMFNWCCLLLDFEDGVCTLSNIFGYIFKPLAWLMGVPWKDCYLVGQLIGKKTFVNEFVAYIELRNFVSLGNISKKAEIISTYALCGFSNISSIGIQLGALGAMAPSRRADLAQIAVRAMIAGNIACFLTACVAGVLIPVDEGAMLGGNLTDFTNSSDSMIL